MLGEGEACLHTEPQKKLLNPGLGGEEVEEYHRHDVSGLLEEREGPSGVVPPPV